MVPSHSLCELEPFKSRSTHKKKGAENAKTIHTGRVEDNVSLGFHPDV